MLLGYVMSVALTMSLAAAETDSVFLNCDDAAEILEPASQVQDLGALGGKCLCLSGLNGRDALPVATAPKPSRGQVVFRPRLPRRNEYRLWARIQWHCTCSASAVLDTSSVQAVDAAGKQQHVKDIVLGDSVLPRVWHWLDCGTFLFDAGEQEIRLVQRGHHALVDTLMISPDLKRLPPGYVKEQEVFNLAECPNEWQTPAEGRVAHRLGEQEWGNFALDLSMNVSRLGFRAEASTLGVGFCGQKDGQGYEFLLSREGDDHFSAQLRVLHGGAVRTLATNNRIDGDGLYHSFRLVHLVDKIAIHMDGLPILDVSDSSFPSGGISLIAENLERLHCEEISIQSVGGFEEHFAGGMSEWRTNSGKWRIASEQSADATTMYCLGSGTDGGLCTSTWPLRDSFAFSTQMQLLSKGRAGLAFAIIDNDNYHAVTIGASQEGTGDSSRLDLLRVCSGKPRVVWSTALPGTAGQWHDLALEKRLNAISIRLGGVELAGFQSPEWSQGAGAGLCFSAGSTVRFAEARAKEDPFSDMGDFVFERDTKVRSISHWRLQKGSLTLNGHPATVTLAPEGLRQEVGLQLRRPLSPNCQLKATLDPAPKKEHRNERNGELGLTLPTMELPSPDSPRIGFVLKRLTNPPAVYQISVDRESMCDMILLQDGHERKRKMLRSVNSSEPPQIWVRIEPGRLSAGTQAEAAIVLEDSTVCNKSDQFEVAFWGENISQESPVKVDGFFISPCLPVLGASAPKL